PAEYRLDVTAGPIPLKAGSLASLLFRVIDPWKGRTVSNFEVVHDKLFHAFIVSQDLGFFAHLHPTQKEDGTFTLDVKLPKKGLYQVLGDFYPNGSTPQLVPAWLIVKGGQLKSAVLRSDYVTPRQGENLQVQLSTNPVNPVAGKEAELYFTLSPGDGIEQ